jgi:ATP-binding cassette subfamily B protein
MTYQDEIMPDADLRTKRSIPTWKIIWRLICFKPWIFISNLMAMFLLMGAWQIPGLVIREFFNQLTRNAPAEFGVWTLVAFMFASELTVIAGVYWLTITNVPFFVHSLTLLRHNLLRHILRRPGASSLPDSPGEAVSRFRNDALEMPLFALWMNDLLGSIAFCVVALVIMSHINAKITMMAVLPFIIVGIVANFAMKKIEMYRRASRKASGIVSGFIGELFGAVQAVKAATAEKEVITHFHNLNEERRVISLKDRLFNEILRSIFMNATNLGTGIILILAGQAMREKTFSVGDFSLFVFYLGFISELTAFVGLLVARYQQIGVSADRMHRLMEGSSPEALVEFIDTHLDGSLPKVTYATESELGPLHELRAESLSYTFPNSENGIRDISFTIPRGSFTVVTGRNGSGKTTLLRVMLGLLSKDEGKIYWNANEVENPGEFFVPPHSAYTAQVPRLFSDTLRDNILMGIDKNDDAIYAAMFTAVLEEDLSQLDDGLETRVGPKGVKLSGGQMQRTAAARMFVREPELLVFDDLSSALDVETEKKLWERVFKREGATCLVVSHRKAALRSADQIIVMQDGRIDAIGKLAELLKTNDELNRLWHGVVEKEEGLEE